VMLTLQHQFVGDGHCENPKGSRTTTKPSS
jgi:hypothetical protein